MPRLPFFIFVLLFGTAFAPKSHAQTAEGWGFRLGMLDINAIPGARPMVQPYYEAGTAKGSSLTIIADLTLAFTDFSHMEIPSYDEHSLLDYGFHAGVRDIMAHNNQWSYFFSLMMGADVFPDPPNPWPGPDPGYVCASFPLTAGTLYDLSTSSQLELALTARPVWYFRQSWGFSYAITAGLRFPSF